MTTKTKSSVWSKAQVKKFGDELRKRYRGVWPHIGEDLKLGLVSTAAASICSYRDDIELTGKDIRELQYDLAIYLGICWGN